MSGCQVAAEALTSGQVHLNSQLLCPQCDPGDAAAEATSSQLVCLHIASLLLPNHGGKLEVLAKTDRSGTAMRALLSSELD